MIGKTLDWPLKTADEALDYFAYYMWGESLPYGLATDEFIEQVTQWAKEVRDLKQWVNDLQSGMYINCVYCGHRYGPKEDTPVAMADVLKEHIEQCPKHPMSKLKKELEEKDELLKEREQAILELRSVLRHG